MNASARHLVFACFLVAACHHSEPYTQTPPLTLPANVTRVQVIHFSDYHAHAAPYFSEHEAGVAGIARALAYVKQVKAADPNLLVLNGGDMFNSGTPAWSDKYGKECADWKWWNGIVTAMAFGNHDVDYGWDSFVGCQKQAQYPVLSGNLVDAADNRIFSVDDMPYLIKKVGEVKIGMFALAGHDFTNLVKPANLPPGAKFSDPLAAARRIVKTLREQEKVDAVIFFGHQDRDSDFAMAKQVPGIDLILGTHSHYKGDFQTIPGTETRFISPFQYLNYLSHVELIFTDGTLHHISGRLVRMSPGLPEDSAINSEVAQMQRALESDPLYAPRFQVIGQAAVELDLTNIDRGESVLGNFVMDTVRTATPANLAFSTASSFRASIPPGSIRLEDYLTAVPYKNSIYSLLMTGAQVQELLDFAVSKLGSDNFAVASGVRYNIVSGKAQDVAIAKDPTSRTSDYEPLRSDGTYTVMATDFLANNATSGYKTILDKASSKKDTGLIVNDVVIGFIKANSPVSAKIEGRITPTGTGGN